jgi:hypothetical protein
MKKTEEGNDLLLRRYEWAGKSAEVQIIIP